MQGSYVVLCPFFALERLQREWCGGKVSHVTGAIRSACIFGVRLHKALTLPRDYQETASGTESSSCDCIGYTTRGKNFQEKRAFG